MHKIYITHFVLLCIMIVARIYALIYVNFLRIGDIVNKLILLLLCECTYI